ncbi:hypothetical protein VTL71DRAFT_7821 [Oculimacula yallundae]|uniref:Alpha-acetolactate decarboxylase n=1 Tax=Oculimacula yallundae TaxID=86028 RepID=A0ABR4CVS3_9HELO
MSSQNQIYQFSIISALMSGLASPSSSIPISALLAHGTFGMGTFASMDGEMVILDSVAYQFHADGSIEICAPTQLVPFALITNFVPSFTKKLSLSGKGNGDENFSGKKALEKEIEKCFPEARNLFVCFRLEGVFKRVKIRAIHKQRFEGEKLEVLAQEQAERTLEGVRGTVVGFRSPGWSVGVSVVGVHAHFVDEGRKVGGHILEIKAEDGTEVTFEGSVSANFSLELPQSKEFGEKELDLDVLGIEKAEG